MNQQRSGSVTHSSLNLATSKSTTTLKRTEAGSKQRVPKIQLSNIQFKDKDDFIARQQVIKQASYRALPQHAQLASL